MRSRLPILGLLALTIYGAQVFAGRSAAGGILGRLFGPCAKRCSCAAPLPRRSTPAAAVPIAPALEGLQLEFGPTTRVADPKLAGGGVNVSFRLLPAGASASVVVEVLRGASLVCEVWSGTVSGGMPGVQISWPGKDAAGDFVATGDYRLRVRGTAEPPAAVETPVSIVRLGVTEMSALPTATPVDEWQMVYFLKGEDYEFYATPHVHEYLSTAEEGQISDLDLDDGQPRPVPGVHSATDNPVLEGTEYEDDSYNYPLCYLKGATPRLCLTWGATATSAQGQPMSPGYPVAGVEIRARTRVAGTVLSTSGPIAPGGNTVLSGPPLPNCVTRIDHPLELSWQYRESGAADWTDVPGATTIPLRCYTLIGPPRFAATGVGTQYAGPWVEVAEYWHQWNTALGTSLAMEADCVQVQVKGFFGQNSGIPTAIEGMQYDSPVLGGGHGTTHYFNGIANLMRLSKLLNGHASSPYFNCQDNMGATSTMLAMMGVEDVETLWLGPMNLRAIWGIGAPGYTLELFGSAHPHAFDYHCVVTRDGGASVIETCLQVDADGSPHAIPGQPGWNTDRPWSGGAGYEGLSSTGSVTRLLVELPRLK